MKLKFHSVDCYVLLWALFHIGRCYSISSIMLLLPILMLWSFMDVIWIHRNVKITNFVVIYDIMLVMFILYGSSLLISGYTGIQMKNTDYLVKALQSLLPFYTFYRHSKNHKLDIKRIVFWFPIFAVVAILEYYYQLRNSLIMHFGSSEMSEADEVINNGSYVILGLLPIVFLMKRKVLQLICILGCSYLILVAFKRGPILILFICILYYIFYFFNFSGKRLWFFFLIMGAVFVGYQYLMDFYMTSDFLQARIEQTLEGNSSSRDVIAGKLLSVFSQSDILHLFFGYGAYGTLSLVGRLAHNDWLQILVDQGVIGFLINCLFFWQLFVNWKKCNSEDNSKLAYGIFLIIYFMTSLFSMAFDRIPLYEMVVLSYVITKNEIKPCKKYSLAIN